MFFVSEEFLRRHEDGEEVRSTLTEVLEKDGTLFPDEKSHKAEMRDKVRKQQEGSSSPGS